MKLRASNLETLQEREFDVLIVGGGINGAVTASALTSQGAKVALIDRGDFASQTSQESSNLAWGGIKYLESFEFRLVRKLCKSRNHLLKSYPSIVKEIRFFTVLDKGFRKPRWMLFMGTLLYWAMGNFATKAPRLLSKKSIAKREPAVRAEASVGGVEYSDAYFVDNDCRFVFKFIREALDHGGIVANYVESLGCTREDGVWTTSARDVISGKEIKIRSKALVNCCGPYADNHNSRTSTESSYRHVFSKGVHLLVPRITSVVRVLTFFADDGRMFFVIPMGNKTSVGTTDTRVTELPAQVTEEDRDFILDNINKRLRLENPLTRDDIIAERCGVRPLVVSAADAAGSDADWISLSRKHEMSVDSENSHLTIYGGKLTDCINVGNEATEKLTQMGLHLPYKGFKWYGEPPDEFRDEYFHQAKLMELDKMTSPDSSEPLSTRLWRRYYASAMGLLEDIRRDPKMAEVLIEGTEYIRCELYYAANHEMVTTLDDFLRRRSKISLVEKTETIQKASGLLEACEILFGDEAQEKFDDYFAGLGKVVEHDRLET